MHAVVVTGGKQYRVTAGETINVEKLAGNVGDFVKIETILTLSGANVSEVGAPSVSGAVVTAQIVGQFKGDKVIIFKKKRRHNYRRKNGHRQLHTALHITDIALSGKSLVSAPAIDIAARAASKAAAKAAIDLRNQSRRKSAA
jgi:large subunit ribosomal protein L21